MLQCIFDIWNCFNQQDIVVDTGNVNKKRISYDNKCFLYAFTDDYDKPGSGFVSGNGTTSI